MISLSNAECNMAHFLSSYPSISRTLYTDPSSGYKLVKRATGSNLINGKGYFEYFERERNSLVQCCTSSTSSAEEVGLVGNGRASAINGKGDQLGYLVNEYGWKVRRLALKGDEMTKAAQVQAEAFHEPALFFDDFFFHFFQAEVLSALLYKLRNSPPDRYACLVAEPNSEDSDSNSEQEVVGVVDVTVLRDQNVLELLPSDAEEYLYVSGIAVLNNFRRKKIATVLLKACDMLSVLWGFEYLVLRAYEDDLGARKLYSNAGYRVVSGDPPWMTTWIGRKRRVLLIKHFNPHT